MAMKYSFFIFVSSILLGINCSKSRIFTTEDPVEPGDIPYIVAIYKDGIYVCGGSLISNQHVLTAAHCVYDYGSKHSHSNLSVRVGTTDINSNSSNKIVVDRVRCHPEYEIIYTPPFYESVRNDIAVIRLRESITESRLVRRIALPRPNQEYRNGTRFVVSGFGRNSSTTSSDQLRKLTTYSVSQETCQLNWSHRVITPGHLCTLSKFDSGICFGDSGGPLTLNGKVLVGVVSESSDDACGTSVPDIFTKVSHYIKFIRNEIKQTGVEIIL